jgi:hypothetical protein
MRWLLSYVQKVSAVSLAAHHMMAAFMHTSLAMMQIMDLSMLSLK